MKNCTITSSKVRTTYDVRISAENLLAIVQEIAQDQKKALLMATHKAFEGVNLDEITNRRAAANLLRKIWNIGDQDVKTERFIASEMLDFDGIDNYGYFDEVAHQGVMVVYHNGDRLNR